MEGFKSGLAGTLEFEDWEFRDQFVIERLGRLLGFEDWGFLGLDIYQECKGGYLSLKIGLVCWILNNLASRDIVRGSDIERVQRLGCFWSVWGGFWACLTSRGLGSTRDLRIMDSSGAWKTEEFEKVGNFQPRYAAPTAAAVTGGVTPPMYNPPLSKLGGGQGMGVVSMSLRIAQIVFTLISFSLMGANKQTATYYSYPYYYTSSVAFTVLTAYV